MAEQAVTKTVLIPVLTRNEISVQFIADTFGKRSANKGKTFFRLPDATADNWSSLTTFVGMQAVWDVFTVEFRKVAMDLMSSNIDEKTGEFDEESWLADWQELSVERVTLSDLDEKLEGLYDQQSVLMEETDDDKFLENAPKLRALSSEVKALKAKKEEITAKYQARSEKRKAAKLAKEEAAKKASDAAKVVAATPHHHIS